MATSKVKHFYTINLTKNIAKGGSWLLHIMTLEGTDFKVAKTTAWANASAAKREAKEYTGRKTIKWETDPAVDDKGKPITFTAHFEARNI